MRVQHHNSGHQGDGKLCGCSRNALEGFRALVPVLCSLKMVSLCDVCFSYKQNRGFRLDARMNSRARSEPKRNLQAPGACEQEQEQSSIREATRTCSGHKGRPVRQNDDVLLAAPELERANQRSFS
jgi:hypothetical protein